MSIVVWPQQAPEWIEALREAAGTTQVVAPGSEADAVAAAPSAEGWIGRLTPALLAAAPRLRWLHAWNTGMERIIFPELVASDVTATNMRHIFDDHVANFVLGLFLALCRDLPRLTRMQMRKEWAPDVPVSDPSMVATHVSMRPQVDTRDPGDMMVLVLGLGGIGAEVARRIATLGATVIGIDPKVAEPTTGVSEVAKPDRLDELLARADTVVVCAPQTPQTTGLFDEARFRMMKRGSFFINLGRGEMVDEAALARALSEKWIGGAALDVFEKEPLPSHSPLWDAENVIVMPHIGGWGGPHTDAREVATAVENVRRFVAKRPLLNVVDKAVWY
jgi:phosphoglycerate dehydrogenase-like enzyme